ncbi:unnamed protein product [Parascedosporium putredinis]|uniref:Succinyl-CoA synthetase beta chain n=1 Tax=Parascedosporium putredinis TaxID=1442378 RepID=A0A9P1H132_9PEZI|nr:unnamed protein product [Parascedosporium putredinis]CAI7993409.1 unnamed protein product [Parascedosporium putredinis]
MSLNRFTTSLLRPSGAVRQVGQLHQRRRLSLYEYQSQALMREAGIPVPKGKVAETPAQVREIVKDLGGECVVKSQMLKGGRGKGSFDNGLQGGIHFVKSPDQAEQVAALVQCEEEWYLAMTIDREAYSPVIILSRSGGVDIETLARTAPEKLHTFHFSLSQGITPDLVKHVATSLDASQIETNNLRDILERLFKIFSEKDATLLEINPLGLGANGSLTGLDAKFSFDKAAEKRQRDLFALRDPAHDVPEEVEAEQYGLVYVRMEGTIGNVVNGAGLAMATNDAVAHHGGASANFLDAGGQATRETMQKAFEIILRDPRVKAILVNVYGGITRCDMIAESIIGAAKDLGGFRVPVVARLQGTNSAEGLRLLDDANLGIHTEAEFGEAARKGVKRHSELEIQQAVLKSWGFHWQILGDDGTKAAILPHDNEGTPTKLHKYLQKNRYKAEAIFKALSALVDTLSDQNKLGNRYGIQLRRTETTQDESAHTGGIDLVIPDTAIIQIEPVIAEAKNRLSVLAKLKWAMKDRENFKKLIAELKFHGDTLYRLCPENAVPSMNIYFVMECVAGQESPAGLKWTSKLAAEHAQVDDSFSMQEAYKLLASAAILKASVNENKGNTATPNDEALASIEEAQPQLHYLGKGLGTFEGQVVYVEMRDYRGPPSDLTPEQKKQIKEQERKKRDRRKRKVLEAITINNAFSAARSYGKYASSSLKGSLSSSSEEEDEEDEDEDVAPIEIVRPADPRLRAVVKNFFNTFKGENGHCSILYKLPGTTGVQTRERPAENLKLRAPVALKSLLGMERVLGIDASLGARFRLARKLVRAVCLLHSSGWLHKNIRAQSSIYGFDMVGKGMLKNVAKDSTVSGFTLDYYQHPAKHANPRRLYRHAYDVYSLGILLLEIGLWKELHDYKHSGDGDEDHYERRRWVCDEYLGRLRWVCGDTYADVVLSCLMIDSSDEEAEKASERELCAQLVAGLENCQA